MKLKEISKDIYDVSALLDEEFGTMGTPERQKNTDKAWEEYNAQILLDARKNAGVSQTEFAERIGADKRYISRITVEQRSCILKVDDEVKTSKDGFEAFRRLREIAESNGLPDMTLDEINEEIRLARAERKRRL